jgi:hypothetical protein
MKYCWIALLFGVTLLHGCYRTRRLSPPPEPERVAPPVSTAGAPGPGLSRIILDATPERAMVEKVSGGSVAGVAGTASFGAALTVRSRLCTTPCVVDVTPGPYELRFTSVDDRRRTSSGFVNVDLRPSVYRHALGRQESHKWKGFVGWPVVLTGSFIALGMLDDDVTTNGKIGYGAVGGGLIGLGAWLIMGSTVIEQPGSGVQFHPE